MDWGVVARNGEFLLGGLGLTFQLALAALAGGLPLGTLIGLGRLSRRRAIHVPCTLYVNLVRSQPIILVVLWFYFLAPILTGRPLGDFPSACIAFVVFEASYFAEIVRAGIQSVPRGQVEAGLATGLGTGRVMLYVVLPQALRNMLPTLITQVVILFQDTSVAYVIGLKEFLRRVNITDLREFRSVELYTFAALVYLVLCSLGVLLSSRLEQRASPQAAGVAGLRRAA